MRNKGGIAYHRDDLRELGAYPRGGPAVWFWAVVLMAAPCLMQDDGTRLIPQAYRRYIELQGEQAA